MTIGQAMPGTMALAAAEARAAEPMAAAATLRAVTIWPLGPGRWMRTGVWPEFPARGVGMITVDGPEQDAPATRVRQD